MANKISDTDQEREAVEDTKREREKFAKVCTFQKD